MGRQRFSAVVPIGQLSASTLAGVLGTAIGVDAQALKDLQTPDTPLVLKAQGSFFVGGEKVEQTQGELGDLGPGGHITVNQMYVRYMVPQGGDGNVPVVMVHGATLTGKSWETTPDGRMGWDEYFVRKGHPVYVPDQVGRGRSGFNQAVFNDVRAGSTPPANQPVWLRFSDEGVWSNFRIGPTPGQPFPDTPVSGGRAGRAREAGCARRQLRWHPHAQPDAQGVVGPRWPVAWRRRDGALAVRFVPAGSGADQSRGNTKGLVLVEPGRCPHVHGRAGRQPGDGTDAGRLRRSPRHADRPSDPAHMAGSLRGVSDLDRPRQERPAVDAQMLSPAETRRPRQQPHDHAGQEHLQIADLILHVDR